MSPTSREEAPKYTRRPDLYDVEHRGDIQPGEIAFYRDLALQHGGPVLELGFGTGRVGLELARAGIEVTGLDRSEAMLEQARRKLADEPEEVRRRVTLVHGDMRDFDLGRRFRLVYVPFRAFLHLRKQEDQRLGLRRVAAHLEPAGRFAGNFFRPRLELLHDSPHERMQATSHREDGTTWVITWWSTGTDTHDQQREILLHTRIFGPDGALQTDRIDPLYLTWIFGREWKLLLEVEGFQLEAFHGGFHGESPSDGWEYVWIAHR